MLPDPAAVLQELYESEPGNRFDDGDGCLFDPPVHAIADAADPWFARLKEVIGEFHWSPQEALALCDPSATARCVICWALPISERARLANRPQKEMPSRDWAYVRTFGNGMVARMARRMEGRLRAMGFAAVAPGVAPQNKVEERPRVSLSSCWSERHTAFVAGLGTFGLSGGLITARGIAHRLASVVTDADLPATPRPYGDDPFAWCLRSARDACGVCIGRCPSGSVRENVQERDKAACIRHVREVVAKRGREEFGWEGTYGCGLCQTGTPCEHHNPTE